MDKDDKLLKSNAILKKHGVKVKLSDTGKLTFIIPKTLEDNIKKHYNFSIDMLQVGGEISLPELVVHCDEQPALEYNIGTLCEFVRYQLKQKEDEFEMWLSKKYFKVKEEAEITGKKHLTEKAIENLIKVKYEKRYLKYKQLINELEMQYRLLSVIKSALQTKGVLLGTIRAIIQGKDGVGIDKTDKNIVKKIRNKLKIN